MRMETAGTSFLGDCSFFEADFKKQDGFKKTMLLSKELQLYRQNYCGCIYSIRAEG